MEGIIRQKKLNKKVITGIFMAKIGNYVEITQIIRTELEICPFSEFWQSQHPDDEQVRTQLGSQHRFDQIYLAMGNRG